MLAVASLPGCGGGATTWVEHHTFDEDDAPSMAGGAGGAPGGRFSFGTDRRDFAASDPMVMGGSGSVDDGPPFGESTYCGDGIVGLDEECDDGDADADDACSPACLTLDQLIETSGAASRSLGRGRHPLSASNRGFAATYVTSVDDVPAVKASLFDIWGSGTSVLTVSEGASPLLAADPVVAALPGGAYAIAWTDSLGDGVDLGVALRRIEGDGALGPLTSANDAVPYPQRDADLVWTGDELIAAWVDYAQPSTGPDIHYRRFDTNLGPLSEPQVGAATSAAETELSLARVGQGFALAYRETGAARAQHIIVQLGESSYRLGPILSPGRHEPPALVELDPQHLLVLFSADVSGGSAAPELRLFHAVIDTTTRDVPSVAELEDPARDTICAARSCFSPSVAVTAAGTFVGWRSGSLPADAFGDQVWLKRLRWSVEASQLDTADAAVALPRTCRETVGNQGALALGDSVLPPGGGLIAAWEDDSRSMGDAAGTPDVVLQYAATHAGARGWGSLTEACTTESAGPSAVSAR